MNDGYFYLSEIDEFGKQVIKTKRTHPYSYDGFVTYRNGENCEADGTIWSDRLSQWNYAKKQELMQKHFGKTSENWTEYSKSIPEKIQNFLQDWTGNKSLKLILVMEYCNVSSGYPVWRFEYANGQEQ